MGSTVPSWVPMVTSTASKPSDKSALGSATRVPQASSMRGSGSLAWEISRMVATSASTVSSGRR